MWPLPSPCTDASLQPYLDQIDQIHASVASLEQTAYRLDAYTKQLGECIVGQQLETAPDAAKYELYLIK